MLNEPHPQYGECATPPIGSLDVIVYLSMHSVNIGPDIGCYYQ